MFTGLVVERGRVAEDPTPAAAGGVRLVLEHSLALGERLPVGASVAVAGTCLTVVAGGGGRSEVELSPETLSRTTLGTLARGSEVNLEPPMRVGDPLGGHWVQGHVDGKVEVVKVERLGEHAVVSFDLPPELSPFVVEKGSVALDGVSLTVAGRWSGGFSVALIPHTLAVTTLGTIRPGDRLNLEVDILAKYVVQALADRGALVGADSSGDRGEAS